MVYIPWADYGICKYWMLRRCHGGSDCKWRHPDPEERKWLWDEETRRQDEAARRGIPRPQPRRKKEPEREVSALDAPPSPKSSPKKAKGVNSTRPTVNANLAELGRPNRLLQSDVGDEISIKGAASGITGMKGAPMVLAPVIPSENYNERDQLLLSDIPSPFAVTSWRRQEVHSNPPMARPEDSPLSNGNDYWERRGEKNEESSKAEDEKADPNGILKPAQSRPKFPHNDESREPPTSSALPPPAFSPLTTSPPASMGATKRMSNGEAKHVGPYPSTIRVSTQYVSQNAVEKKLRPPSSQAQFDVQERSIAEAREDSMRLQGCTWIDNVRRALQLPIRTYTTACVYYHKFRLAHPGILNGMEYGNSWADACAASLLTSCKTEDTLKKSRDILAAAYNLKANTHDQVGSDDPMFDASSRAVIGLERLVLESGGFDFRSKYPHRLLMKILKKMPEGVDDEREKVTQAAWSSLTDLYRTFAPLKQTAATMALASLELAAHLVAASDPNNVSAIRDELQQYDISNFSTSREEVMETLLDVLDMYTQHIASTILGTKYSLDDFLKIRLAFNKECNEKSLPRQTISQPANSASNGSTLRVANGHPTPVSPPQPESQTQQHSGSQQTPESGGTQRFVLNPQLAAEEKVEVQKYFVEEWEEYEEEVEIPASRPADQTAKEGTRSEKGTPRPKENSEGERDKLKDREREIERDRARVREREREREGARDRRFEDRRYDDRFEDRGGRYDDRRGRRYEDRRYDDDRRRRDSRH